MTNNPVLGIVVGWLSGWALARRTLDERAGNATGGNLYLPGPCRHRAGRLRPPEVLREAE